MKEEKVMKRIIVILVTVLICFSLACTICTAEDSNAEYNDCANSWRYSNGKTIEDETATKMLKSAAYHSNATKTGIDVSEHQGVINWEKVKASGIDFAIIRCGYGMNLSNQDDAQFERNASECERLGIPYGVYLYSYANTVERASSEADHVLRLIKGHKLSFPVYFDMEDSSTAGSNYAALAKTFCGKIEKAGYPVGVYANLNWWNNRLTDTCFNNWYRWVAQYYSTCQYKGNYAMWQYTSSGSVNGINGRVDMNYLIGYPDNHGLFTSSVEEGTYTIGNLSSGSDILSIADSTYEDNATVSMLDGSLQVSSQRFEIIATGTRKYMILAEHSGKALSIKEGSNDTDLYVCQETWSGKPSQIWEFINNGDGNYYIKSQSGKYLAVKNDEASGIKIVATDLEKSEKQIWVLSLSEEKPIEDGVYSFESIASPGKVISVEEGNIQDNANLCLAGNDELLSQQYYVRYEGKGYYSITAEHSNKAWQAKSDSYAEGINLQQNSISNIRSQQYKFVDDGSGNYYIKAKTGTAVTLTDKNISMGLIVPSEQQKWKLSSVDIESVKDGTYMVSNNNNKKYSLTSISSNPVLYEQSELIEQKYNITNAGNGYYKIENTVTGKVLDVKNGSRQAETKIQEYPWNGTDAQLWRIIDLADGQYLIKSKLGYFIDVKNGLTNSGSEILTNDRNSNASQKWLLSKSKTVFFDQSESSFDDVIERTFTSGSGLRIAGRDRYQTSLEAANTLKKELGINKFKNIVIASGDDFPDALSGSYLAGVKNAPILLVNSVNTKQITDYIKDNLESDGVVYILGGKGVVSEKLELQLKELFKIKRLAGEDRYDTNLAILDECGISADELLVCSGDSFADSLSVSSTGKPLLLVGKTVEDKQIEFLLNSSVKDIYIIGGCGAVNTNVETSLRHYFKTTRIAGLSRYTTSMAVAEAFFGDLSDCVVLSYAQNFPDGLSGGAVALNMGAPLVLADGTSYSHVIRLSDISGYKYAAVMGGPILVPDSVVRSALN